METKNHLLDMQPAEPEHNKSMWVLSYCDLLCQLICFFVLLFATSSVKKQQWEQIRTSLAQRLDPTKETTKSQPAAEITIEKKQSFEGQDISYLRDIVLAKIAAQPSLKGEVIVQQVDGRVVISIAGDAAFLSGNAKMTPKLESTLVTINDIIGSTRNRVEIHGNADPHPVTNKLYPSNWELSLARALAVGGYLRGLGYPYHLSVYGRGDTAYNDLPAGLSNEQRERLSRRIDIVIRVDRAEFRP